LTMFVRAIQTRTIHLRHALVRHMSYGSTYSPSDYHKVADRLAKFLAQAEPGVLGNGAIGVEREALRVDRTDGKLSSSRHPEEWGSALKHPFVTTDFSESMPEYVTPIFSGADKVTECQAFLTQLLALTSQSNPNREEELLWPCPMPMRVDDPGTVPIAEFGKSNIGMMKSTYRRGLTNRYGSVMQLISGIHFNYSVDNKFWPVFQQLIKDEASAAASSSSSSSFSSSSSGDPVDPNVSAQDFQSAQYFGLIRNFQRVGWMIPYLFGTSPVIDESFVAKREGMESFPLPSFMRDTLYRPEATSLRMSDIGYVRV
jgi:glutamate--cysteine ligase